MTARHPAVLAAVVDAVWTADPDQLPLTGHALVARTWRRLGGPVVSADEVIDAAAHLGPVGLTARDGSGWRTGPMRPDQVPVTDRHEAMFRAARRRLRGVPR